MRAVAASVPLYVMLDDFHCADGQSVAVLKHLAMSVEQAPLGGRGHLPMTERGYVAFEPRRCDLRRSARHRRC